MTRTIIAAALALHAGASFAANDYGGYDIAGATEGAETEYAEAGNWVVYQGKVGGEVAYCFAQSDAEDRIVRVGSDRLAGTTSGQWQLAVLLPSSQGWEGTLGPLGDERFASGTANGEWTIAWLTKSDLARPGTDEVGRIVADGQDFSFPLDGITAASLAVTECAGID